MKTLFTSLLVVVSLCSWTRAGTMSIAFPPVVVDRTNAVSVPRDGVLQVNAMDKVTTMVEWRVQDIAPANAGDRWVVTEGSAATYGLDWQVMEQALRMPYAYLYLSGMHDGGVSYLSANTQMPYAEYAQPISQPITKYQIDELLEIELHVEDFFVSPIGSLIVWQHTLLVEGSVVPIPEPSSLMLAALALVMAWRVSPTGWPR